MKTVKNNDIQCLRAVAIILVIVQHWRNRLPAPEWYGKMFDNFGFWSGVDIFFAISGFLICKTFLNDLNRYNSPKVALQRFGMRRIIRLVPALIFWCIFSIALAYFVTSVADASPFKVALSAATGLIGISNLYWSHCVQTGISACGNPDFNGVIWSLSLEWQLYIVLVVLLCLGRPAKAIFVMVVISISMSFYPGPSFSYVWAFRVQAFTLGALIFSALNRNNVLQTVRIPRLVNILLLMIGIGICIRAPSTLVQPFIIPSIAIGAALCLISALSANSYSRSKISVPFIWIGERSYSIYLCHLPAILVTREIVNRTSGLYPPDKSLQVSFLLGISLILIASNLSYRFIEQAFQKRLKLKYI